MKLLNLMALTGTALIFAACIPSVHPFYTDNDVIFDTRLLGEWRDKDKTGEAQTWNFEPGDAKTYKLTLTEQNGKRGEFKACLFKLEGNLFLDLTPTECKFATNQADLVGASIIPGHLLLRVPRLDSELQLAFCKFEWLENFLKKEPTALAHHQESNHLVLTAETRDLQRFVLQHLGEGELFDQSGGLVRATNAAPASVPSPSR